MNVHQILAVLADAAGLEVELRAVKTAPPSLDELLIEAHGAAQRAAEAFRLAAWQVPSTDPAAISFAMMGMAMTLAAEAASALITEQVSRRVAADPRPALDRGTRAKRTAKIESKLADAAGKLSRDDLDRLRDAVSAVHASYRGLAERLGDAEQNAIRRAAAIANAQRQRERIGRPAPPPLGIAGDPFASPVAQSAPLSRAERIAAEKALEAQLEAEAKQLGRDQASVATLKAETAAASERWRQLAMAADHLERLLQSRAAPLAAA